MYETTTNQIPDLLTGRSVRRRRHRLEIRHLHYTHVLLRAVPARHQGDEVPTRNLVDTDRPYFERSLFQFRSHGPATLLATTPDLSADEIRETQANITNRSKAHSVVDPKLKE